MTPCRRRGCSRRARRGQDTRSVEPTAWLYAVTADRGRVRPWRSARPSWSATRAAPPEAVDGCASSRGVLVLPGEAIVRSITTIVRGVAWSTPRSYAELEQLVVLLPAARRYPSSGKEHERSRGMASLLPVAFGPSSRRGRVPCARGRRAPRPRPRRSPRAHRAERVNGTLASMTTFFPPGRCTTRSGRADASVVAVTVREVAPGSIPTSSRITLSWISPQRPRDVQPTATASDVRWLRCSAAPSAARRPRRGALGLVDAAEVAERCLSGTTVVSNRSAWRGTRPACVVRLLRGAADGLGQLRASRVERAADAQRRAAPRRSRWAAVDPFEAASSSRFESRGARARSADARRWSRTGRSASQRRHPRARPTRPMISDPTS